MPFDQGDKVLFIGDSITDCGRSRPVGEARRDGLGNGYVSLIDAFLQSSYPEKRIRVVNVGTGGNTVRDLKERWHADVFNQRPDWLSIMIGINDVWRQFDCPTMPEMHVLQDEYEETLLDLVARTRANVKGLVLMTPFFLEPNRADVMRSMVDLYGRAVERIARRTDCLFVDIQAEFMRVLAGTYSAAIAWDRVHPNLAGHMVIARAFLRRVESE